MRAGRVVLNGHARSGRDAERVVHGLEFNGWLRDASDAALQHHLAANLRLLVSERTRELRRLGCRKKIF